MSLLAEEVVEEWLNRDGFFTIHGAKVGVYEIDILAIRPLAGGGHQCRHVEVQASINPISYITKVPAAVRKQTGIAPHNAKKRELPLLRKGVQEWVGAKFDLPEKVDLRTHLCPEAWTKELVVGNVKYEVELSLLKEAGVTIHRLKDILEDMVGKRGIVRSAAGADLYDLMQLRE
jgi:hypothetical protein